MGVQKTYVMTPVFLSNIIRTIPYIETGSEPRKLFGMPIGPDEAWQWSEQFLEVVERWLREPPADAITRWDWPKLQVRLVLWRNEVLAAQRHVQHVCVRLRLGAPASRYLTAVSLGVISDWRACRPKAVHSTA